MESGMFLERNGTNKLSKSLQNDPFQRRGVSNQLDAVSGLVGFLPKKIHGKTIFNMEKVSSSTTFYKLG